MTSPTETTGAVRSMLALARTLSPAWWLIAIAVTGGTNLLDFFAAAQPGARTSPLFAAAAIVRIALVFWISYALIRRLAGHDAPARITMAFARFSLLAFAQVVLLGSMAAVARLLIGPDGSRVELGIALFLLTTAIMLILVRLYAWQAALAVGDRTLGIGGAWRKLASHKFGLAAAYLVISAVAVVHMFLTQMALASGGEAGPLTALAIVDGVVSAVQLVLGASLAVAAWRLAGQGGEALRERAAVA